MKILSTTVFRGPNIYALFPVIRHTLDLADLEDWPTGRLGAEFVDDLVESPFAAGDIEQGLEQVGNQVSRSVGCRRPARLRSGNVLHRESQRTAYFDGGSARIGARIRDAFGLS